MACISQNTHSSKIMGTDTAGIMRNCGLSIEQSYSVGFEGGSEKFQLITIVPLRKCSLCLFGR